MNKRLICLFISLIMLLSVALTGCSNGTDLEGIAEDVQKQTRTLTMYLMSDGDISDEKAQQIQDAVNKITKSKFKTQLVLRYYSEEDYNKALDKAFEDTESARKAKEEADKQLKEDIKAGRVTTALKTTEGSTVEETIVNEYGTIELKYPDVEDYQVDIFYLGGQEKFFEYLNLDRLSRLDEDITSSSKLLSTYISPAFLTYAKEAAGGIYAVPNNTTIGEYTYLLLNKDVLAEYNYSATKDSFTSLTCDNVKDILEKVAAYDKEYVPLYSGTGELDLTDMSYFGLDADGKLSGNFSVIGGSYNSAWRYKGINEYYKFDNVLADPIFQKQMSVLMSYKENNYYGTSADAGKPFAVGYVKGGADLVEKYGDDYELVAVAAPKLSTEQLFAHSFAVASHTTSEVSRSMEIITYLNTNEDFRNLILYGIEGEDYELIDSDVKDSEGNFYKVARRLGDKYLMDEKTTGNTVIAYPLEGDLPNIREYQKIQNRDAIADLDIGFTLAYDENNPINTVLMDQIREMSEDILKQINEIKTVAEWDEFLFGKDTDGDGVNDVEGIKDVIRNNELVILARDTTYGVTEVDVYNPEKYGEGASFGYIYFSWLEGMGIYKELQV